MYINQNESGFRYLLLESEIHDRSQTKIWLHKDIAGKRGDEFCFPVRHAAVVQTNKGALVMRPVHGQTVHLITAVSGYRGTAEVSVEDDLRSLEVVASGRKLHSGLGRLGETAWTLCQADADATLTVRGQRTGRRIVGDGRIDYKILPSGEILQAQEEGLERELA